MPSIVADLNPKQQDAVTHWGTPLLILAGAGSGKTSVLTHRAAWLIQEKGLAPESLLLLTFTNKAAGEMKIRIQKLLSPKIQDSRFKIPTPFAGTFHAFCVRVLRKYGQGINIDPNFVIYDPQDQKEAYTSILKEMGVEKATKPQAVASLISQAKNELISAPEYANLAQGEFQKKVAKIYLKYQNLLLQNNAVDFDDLLVKTVKLLKNDSQTLSKLTNQFNHILVDEWQDTNKAQYEIVKLLCKKQGNLTCVGDASQSIYSWRGANYRNIIYLKKDFSNLTTINLEQNYRSTQVILDAAYNVISKNTSHPILKLWTQKDKGEKIKLYIAPSELKEASFIVAEIKKFLDKKHKASDFAILYRMNAQSRQLEEAFLHEGIPYTLIGGVKFYERREIKDVLSYLRLIANPKDKISYNRAEKVGKRRLQWLQDFAGQNSLSKLNALELLDKILETTQYLELYNPEVEEDIARLENIKELRSVATEFPNLHDFLEQVALVETAQTPKGTLKTASNNFEAVSLMTLHAAKGLEFPIVFIAGLEEGIFPHSRSLVSAEELEEERRLAYVGITRAKELLYLCLASRRMLFGQREGSAPSRFLADIPEHLLEACQDSSCKWPSLKNSIVDDYHLHKEDNYDEAW